MRKRYSIAQWLPLTCFLIFCVYKAIQAPVHDFSNYYFGSYFLLKGELDPTLYEALIFNQKIVAAGYDSSWVSYAPNPPFTALLFLPFACLDIEYAKLLFNILSTFLFLFSLIRLARHLKIPELHIAFIPFIFFYPLYNNISFGQVYFLLFFLLVEGYLAMQKERWWLCSLLWAIAIIFKITPGVLFFFLLFKKQYKGLIMLSLTCLTLFLISLTVSGTTIWEFYISTILPRAGQGEATAAAFTINYQSAHMFFKYLFIPNALDNPHPPFESFLVFTIAVLVFKIGIITLAAFYTTKQSSSFSAWAIWIQTSFLISPYGSTYGYILLLIPLLTLYEHKKVFIIYALLSVVLINLPVKYLYEMPFIFQFPRLYLSIAMFVTLVVLASPSWQWKTFIPVACLLISLEVLSFKPQQDSSTYLFGKEIPALPYDYAIEDGYLCYTYWSGRGSEKHKSRLPAATLDFQAVKIIDNQIFYKDLQLTSSTDKKLKASVLNNNTIIYLSDKGRGYGFYTFRSIPIHKAWANQQQK